MHQSKWKKTVRILGIHFSYNKKSEEEKNFSNYMAKIENVSKAWRMRDLAMEGKIAIFKWLAISKAKNKTFYPT